MRGEGCEEGRFGAMRVVREVRVMSEGGEGGW